MQQRAERVARPAEATAARTEEKVTTRSEGKAAARPTDGGSVSSKSERKVLPGGLELPAVGRNDTLIYNEVGRYTFLYRPSCKVSQWVAYKLTRSDVAGGADRSDAFREDPRLARFGWPSATNADYKESGYDRGHLLPSADRKSSVEANRATFLYSNMAPQLPKLNRGAWKVLEERLRRLTADYDTLYVVVGTVVDRSPKSIGDGVAVPRLFFKAVALRRGDDFRGEAYVMPNSAGELAGKSSDRFEVTVDSGLSARLGHPTVKDTNLIRMLVRALSRPGQLVLEPFAGSGTACYVAAELGRRYIGYEIDPKYWEIADRRMKTVQMKII